VRPVDFHQSRSKLGIEPLHFRDGVFTVDGPTWVEQVVQW
jgi:hypothetical protein